MPRHVIQLSPDTYQFDDQPLIHEGIWKAASAIANAPLQMAQIKMDQEDRALANEERAARTQNYRDDNRRADSAAEAAGIERTYQHEKDAKTLRMQMTDHAAKAENERRKRDIEEGKPAKKLQEGADKTKAAELKAVQTRGAKVGNPWMGQGLDLEQAAQYNTEAYPADVAAAEHNTAVIKSKHLGDHMLSMPQAYSATPKTKYERGLQSSRPQTEIDEEAKKKYKGSKIPSVGDYLKMEDEGTDPETRGALSEPIPSLADATRTSSPEEIKAFQLRMSDTGTPTNIDAAPAPTVAQPVRSLPEKVADAQARLSATDPTQRNVVLAALKNADPVAYGALLDAARAGTSPAAPPQPKPVVKPPPAPYDPSSIFRVNGRSPIFK